MDYQNMSEDIKNNINTKQIIDSVGQGRKMAEETKFAAKTADDSNKSAMNRGDFHKDVSKLEVVDSGKANRAKPRKPLYKFVRMLRPDLPRLSKEKAYQMIKDIFVGRMNVVKNPVPGKIVKKNKRVPASKRRSGVATRRYSSSTDDSTINFCCRHCCRSASRFSCHC